MDVSDARRPYQREDQSAELKWLISHTMLVVLVVRDFTDKCSHRNPTPVTRQHMLACIRGSKPVKGNETYPYLMGGLRIDWPNQILCTNFTCLPMRKGFFYPSAIMDWFTRKVLA